MPRFIPEKWKPTDDTSPGFRTLDPQCVVLNLYTNQNDHVNRLSKHALTCPCGCGEYPLGDKAMFRMGHDARLRGILIRAHLMGVRIRYAIDGDLQNPHPAYKVAEKYDWTSYLDTAVLRREGKNRELLQRALGSDRLVKVGRWDYTGGQVVSVYRLDGKDMLEIEYVNRAGDIKRTRVPAEEAPAA